MNRILIAFFALLVASCGAQETAQPPLAGAAIGGPFRLVNQQGRAVTDADLKGKYTLIYFGYTYCPDVCPTDMARIGQGLKQFEEKDAQRGAKVQPVFVTIDPQRDTQAVVGEFVANFHPRFIGLTGSPDAIAETLKAYRVYATREGEGPDYLMNHSANAYLFDPQGQPMVLIGSDQDAASIAADLDRWVS
jgi:protein SCO1/2